VEAVGRLLAERNDVAAAILEPTGATWGQVPITESFLHELREVTADQGVALIFDEVITGFRCSPGGAQGYFGIKPDLTTLAKILAGGFPGGALVGRRDIMDWLDHEASVSEGREKVSHQGTFNANPVSAAAGTAALDIVATTDACQRANDYAHRLREALRRLLQDEHVDWCVYGTFSGFHIFTNPHHESVTAEQINDGRFDYRQLKASAGSELTKKLRVAMLAHGVDIFAWPGGPTSAVHNTDDLEWTVDAFGRSLRMLKDEGDVQSKAWVEASSGE
jgi:glutamate-1-semialdehyde 2,1-aminomutase